MDAKSDALEIPAIDDVCSIIRSPEIREYYRREDVLGIFEKEQLILHSYTSIQQKTALLAQLAKTGIEKERRKISEMCRVFCDYMERIYHPAVRTVFLLESSRLIWDGENGSIDTMKYGLEGAYETVDELIAGMEDCCCGEEDYCADVVVLEVPQGKKTTTPFGFSLYLIDGKWEIKDLYLGYGFEKLREKGFHKDTEERSRDYCGGRHPLPFENGCRLKLQLPFMKEPFYGTLKSELDGVGTWYHFLYYRDESLDCGTAYVELSTWEVNQVSAYSSFDWIERADIEEGDREFPKLFHW